MLDEESWKFKFWKDAYLTCSKQGREAHECSMQASLAVKHAVESGLAPSGDEKKLLIEVARHMGHALLQVVANVEDDEQSDLDS